MTSLTHLWLHSNELTGSVPSGDMLPRNVDDLNLRDNMLTGQIPDLNGLDMATRVRLHNQHADRRGPCHVGGLEPTETAVVARQPVDQHRCCVGRPVGYAD